MKLNNNKSTEDNSFYVGFLNCSLNGQHHRMKCSTFVPSELHFLFFKFCGHILKSLPGPDVRCCCEILCVKGPTRGYTAEKKKINLPLWNFSGESQERSTPATVLNK